jgi:GNAT superfamily N-acetyltransferase
MPSTPVIRSAQQSDFAQWLPLWLGYNAFYGREEDTALPTATTASTWARIHNPDENVFALVAEENGQLIGLVHYLYHRSTTLIHDTCYLQDLFTTPDARGKGTGKMLIEAVYDAARDAGLKRVYWQTHETNQTAMRLYDHVAERSGFVVYRKLL